ncbi:MAG: EscU/YscU/HrcU family type III secretion system export apparatus switch protein [Treponema sp.]|nr:EscU/YscU/HrcU family type III secretion system export apparatus switch protein [Treponema sp.]
MVDKQKAVALKYPEGAAAPFITATGTGNMAEKIIDIAKENDVKVVQNLELAEFLSVQQIGSSVPEEVWPVLAKIFAFVLESQK